MAKQRAIRARDLGIPFDGQPGRFNAITDVRGVEVGHTTIIRGKGKLVVGKGPVRTGVTVIFPRGKRNVFDPVMGGWFNLNGNGEMTGTAWLDEAGYAEGPIAITNTHSVGVVRDALIAWMIKRGGKATPWCMPIVTETWDGRLNDANGFHVKPQHVFKALAGARSGPVAEGGVGGGTGMVCHRFKGGIGTASRCLNKSAGGYTVGVLVQANYGYKRQLTIAGVPVGRLLKTPGADVADPRDSGSIVIIVATDAPLLPHQCQRLARRAAMGLARLGGHAAHDSGDLFLAFSTGNPRAGIRGRKMQRLTVLPSERMDPLFEATVRATEEAIVNALVAAKAMRGINDFLVPALPHDEVCEILRAHGRLALQS